MGRRTDPTIHHPAGQVREYEVSVSLTRRRMTRGRWYRWVAIYDCEVSDGEGVAGVITGLTRWGTLRQVHRQVLAGLSA